MLQKVDVMRQNVFATDLVMQHMGVFVASK